MYSNPDVEVIFEFVGFRKNNLYEGYRPAHLLYDNYLTTGVHNYFDLESSCVKGTITFIAPNEYPQSLWIGKKIEMYEGKTFVGCAIITKILNSTLCRKDEILE